ncbi:beta-N-acetylhexosaminidase [Guggenheimella bovis]
MSNGSKWLILLLVLLLVGCENLVAFESTELRTFEPETTEVKVKPIETLEPEVERVISASRFLVVGIFGTHLTEDEKRIFKEYEIQHVILFEYNIESVDQLQSLVEELREINPNMLITIDEEGGPVQRLKEVGEALPNARKLGKEDRDAWLEQGIKIAENLKKFDIDLTYAPVADIFSNPLNKLFLNRSYGTTPEHVIDVSTAVYEGIREGGKKGVAKHFPGHGDTSIDSHYELPYIDRTLEELEEREMKPFKALIDEGIDGVMVGHLRCKAFGELPTSINPEVFKYLREELQYKGVIFSDDMNMQAISERYGIEEAVFRFLEAGGDLAITPIQGKRLEKLLLGLEERIKELPKEDLQEKLQRIDSLKEERHE